jgi:hypothetical protein
MYAEYSDTQLYTQLQFLMYLFDVRRAQTKLGSDELTYVRYSWISVVFSLFSLFEIDTPFSFSVSGV